MAFSRDQTPRTALYISYFGLREPLVQTQVLPYVRQIQEADVKFFLLTFEPELAQAWTTGDLDQWRRQLRSEGITWICLPYHQRPTLPATLFDILVGAWTATQIVRRVGVDVIHARSHVAAAMGSLAKRFTGVQLIFDIRGLMAEEYVDAGRWTENGLLYRLTKAAEARLMDASDAFVVLTERVKKVLFPGCGDQASGGRPIEVIPCCVDLDRFSSDSGDTRASIRAALGIGDRRVMVYLGALGGWYLTHEMADFVAAALCQDPSTFFLVLTQSSPELITTPLQRLGINPGDYHIRRVSAGEVPGFLAASDVALSFVKPCYSKIASSPTKTAEYLASGLPILATGGIGDTDAVLEGERVGVILRELDPAGYRAALSEMEDLQRDPALPARCRAVAQRQFDLRAVGGVRYRRLYQRLFSTEAVAASSTPD